MRMFDVLLLCDCRSKMGGLAQEPCLRDFCSTKIVRHYEHLYLQTIEVWAYLSHPSVGPIYALRGREKSLLTTRRGVCIVQYLSRERTRNWFAACTGLK